MLTCQMGWVWGKEGREGVHSPSGEGEEGMDLPGRLAVDLQCREGL